MNNATPDFDPLCDDAALIQPRPAERLTALQALCGSAALPDAGRDFNLHCHSTYSYNGYGLNPAELAWRGRRAGLYAMGLVDFDVLDGVEEFLAAAELLDLRACASIETRVFVPELADKVINSPGEPGIAYHMGCGFVPGTVQDQALLDRLKRIAQERTRGLVERVNAYLDAIALDFEADAVPLTPAANVTERHVCEAYDRKAREVFPEPAARTAYWAEKLGAPLEKIGGILDDPATLQGLIRAKTMKAGGVGYVQPAGPDFPGVAEFHAFILANGAIPTQAWLDGTTDGEADPEALLDLMMGAGIAAVNVIPDRNWNLPDPDQRALKAKKLYEFVAAAKARDLPVLAGTEMNAPGQRFVDDFDAPEMAPLYETFLEGAQILHAHTQLQARAGMGYLSDWATAAFASVGEKKRFFATAGQALSAAFTRAALDASMAPGTVIENLRQP